MKLFRSRLLVGFGAFVLAGSLALGQQIEINKSNRTIAVTATDKATADADTATVHIGFQVFAADEKAVYALGSKTSNAIADALKQAGVSEKTIESDNQNIAPVQPFENQNVPESKRAMRQFQVTQSWSVKTSAKNAASVLDTAVQAGANQSGQIEWSVADEDALEAQAAGSALKRARDIADQMAKGLSTTLGPAGVCQQPGSGAADPDGDEGRDAYERCSLRPCQAALDQPTKGHALGYCLRRFCYRVIRDLDPAPASLRRAQRML